MTLCIPGVWNMDANGDEPALKKIGMGNENYVFTMLYTDRREHVFFDKIQFEKL
jgi:hypothetical protein